MDSAEIVKRLRAEARFQLLPLLSSTGYVDGLHLTRFLPGNYIEVVQVWDANWAALARVPDSLDVALPFDGPVPDKILTGSLFEIACQLLPSGLLRRPYPAGNGVGGNA
jgi:hypothetical protein